jgi:hypothetical protein
MISRKRRRARRQAEIAREIDHRETRRMTDEDMRKAREIIAAAGLGSADTVAPASIPALLAYAERELEKRLADEAEAFTAEIDNMFHVERGIDDIEVYLGGRPMRYQPVFRYWTICYTYDAGTDDAYQVRAGAYADEALCDINVALNASLLAEKQEVWF